MTDEAQASSPGPIYEACLAYQQGFERGTALDRAPNPYEPMTSNHEAYAIGYAKGAARSGAAPGQQLLGASETRTLYPFELARLREDARYAGAPVPQPNGASDEERLLNVMSEAGSALSRGNIQSALFELEHARYALVNEYGPDHSVRHALLAAAMSEVWPHVDRSRVDAKLVTKVEALLEGRQIRLDPEIPSRG